MSGAIVSSPDPVTLVGGGAVDPADLADALALAPVLVAADGGAAAALKAGHQPRAVIGDFDSLRPELAARLPAERLHRIAEQESTDFDKALRNIVAPLVLAVGVLGPRIDHQLAAFSTLLRRADRPCLLIGPRELVFHAPPRLALDLASGTRVSLYPMRHVTGRSQGLEWPIDGLELSPEGRIGTSNRATGPLRLEIDAPGLLVMLPRDRLAKAAAALSRQPERPPWPPAPWPAP